MEEKCAQIRADLEKIKGDVAELLKDDFFKNEDMNLQGANIPSSQQGNIRANITLTFRALEDARMRMGKTMQAIQGGISILDK